MEIEIINKSKDGNEIEFRIENLTLAEILREYLNKDSKVELAVWKREHPSELPIFRVKTKRKTPQKAISDATDSIIKDLDKVEKDFNRMK